MFVRGQTPLTPTAHYARMYFMAMFHLSTKPISRKSGRSAAASSAYRSGSKIEDKRTGLTHDYTKKQGVIAGDCFLIQNNEKIKLDRSQVWNTAEQKEKRKDSRTAREIIINLPHELNEKQRAELVAEFAESVAKKYNVAIDYSIHLPDKEGDQRNHHCHIMMTTRTAELDKNNNLVLGKKTALELGNKDLAKLDLPTSQEQIKDLRKEWAETANKHLAKAELDISIDHRSHKDRGLETLPTIKLGWEASAMERKGIQTDKGDYNRQIQATNEEITGLNLDIRFLKVEQQLENMSQEAQISPLQPFQNEKAPTLAEEKENALESESEQNSDIEEKIREYEAKYAVHAALKSDHDEEKGLLQLLSETADEMSRLQQPVKRLLPPKAKDRGFER